MEWSGGRSRVRLAGDRNQVGQFMNDRRGQMIATSVGATAMGRGADTLIVDDSVNAIQYLQQLNQATGDCQVPDSTCSRKHQRVPMRVLRESAKSHSGERPKNGAAQ